MTGLLLLNINHKQLGSKNKFWLFDISFLYTFSVLSFFSAIRDDCGCDYYSYVRHIENIQAGFPNYMEEGFQIVARQIGSFSHNPRYVIILFGILTCFFFVKAIWDQSQNKLLSVYLFLTWGLYFMTFNTIRNYFALSVIFYAIKFLLTNKKGIAFFVLLTIAAAFFHASALVCLPLYLLALNITIEKKHFPWLIVAIIVLLLLQIPLRSYVFFYYNSYEGSEYDTDRVSYLNVIKALFIIGLCLKYKAIVYKDKYLKFYFNLNVFALVLYLGVYWLPEISRIGFYMNMTVIFLIPSLVAQIKSKVDRTNLTAFIIVISFIMFILLLNQFSSVNTRILPYKTWLYDGHFRI